MDRQEILAAFRALPLHRRYDAMRMACTYALDAWDFYTKSGPPIEYTDGVVGLTHHIDMGLPQRAIEAVDRKLAGERVDGKQIWADYSEPITAMQDGDLDFPDGIAVAYYAIYNLFGFVFGLTKLYDDGELVIRQAFTGDGFGDDLYQDWWTRTWDAWATRQPPKYAPTELDDATYAAICDGDLAKAITSCAPDSRLQIALLAIAGRTSEAIAAARRTFRSDAIDDALFAGATDAIAVSSDRKLYAVICGRRYHVRTVDENRMRLDGGCGWELRRVGFTANSKIVCWAGDAADDIGPYETIITGEELDSADYGYRVELAGARTVVAIGSGAELLCASERDIGIVTPAGFERFGDGRVAGGIVHPKYLVTYAGPTFSVWRRDSRTVVVAMELATDIWHAFIVDDRLVLACRDAPARIVSLA